jgi:hypothetical protein
MAFNATLVLVLIHGFFVGSYVMYRVASNIFCKCIMLIESSKYNLGICFIFILNVQKLEVSQCITALTPVPGFRAVMIILFKCIHFQPWRWRQYVPPKRRF